MGKKTDLHPGEAKRELKPRGQKPLYKRIKPDDLAFALALIASGRCMSEAAFSQINVSREALNHALLRGRVVARKLEEGDPLVGDDLGCHAFYLQVMQARGKLRQRLHEQARGIVNADGDPVINPDAESTNALKLLLLTDPELRAPAFDPDELVNLRAAEAAKRGDPPEVDETPEEAAPATPAQMEAYLRREAARLGMVLVPAPEGGGGE